MQSSDAAAQLHAQLEESLWALVTSEDWLAALEVASKFHDYSFANAQLIAIEAHRRGITPSRVAGYRKWQELDRQVRKGEKGIPILAPIIRKTPDLEPDHTPAATRADSKEESERRVVGFRVVHVFDISQTDGEPLPEVRPQHAVGDLPQQWDTLAALIAAEGFTLDLVHPASLGTANGMTTWDSRQVAIRDDLSGAQRFKTAAHELAHIRLHDPDGGQRPECRGVIEVEAESVAYIVAAAAGIDTASYSLPYVATWSDGNANLIAQTAQRVLTCARGILPALERAPTPELAPAAPERETVGHGVVREQIDADQLSTVQRRGAVYSIYPPGHPGIMTRDGGCASCGDDATHLAVYDGPAEPGRQGNAYYELACGTHAERAHRGGAMAYPADVIPGGIPPRGTADRQQDTARIQQVLDRAITHYQTWLRGPKGEAARQHLEGRNFTDEITGRFQLGYAPPSWQTITNALQRDGYTPSDLLAAGVVARARTGRLYDTMRGRLVFPIHDRQGHPRGFAGRLIEGDGPKYLNTPATAIYRKSELLYGHHHAHSGIVHTGEAILVEGYLDAIALHQTGITNAVAAGGTAITTHHLATLRRTTHRVTLTLDGDDAGTQAARRVHQLAEEVDPDLNIRVATLPAGSDPADLVANRQLPVLRKALAEATPLPLHVIDHILNERDSNDREADWNALRDASVIVVGLTDPQLRAQAAELISQRIDWDPAAVERGINYHLTDMDQTRRPSQGRRAGDPSTARSLQR